MAQIDWQRSEWQCVRMVVDQLIGQVVELSKQLQDARRKYSDASDKMLSQSNLISQLHQTVRDWKMRDNLNSAYINELEEDLVSRGVSRKELDSVYEDIKSQLEGGDEGCRLP